jgi:hypothetical protein
MISVIKDVKTVVDLPQVEGEKFRLLTDHDIQGHYARHGYPDSFSKRLPTEGCYQVVAQWSNQLMVAACSEDDSYCSTKHLYVIALS